MRISDWSSDVCSSDLYNGWRYDLEGALTVVQQQEEFFDPDMEEFGLVALRCEIWAGIIFVNCNPEAPPLLDYMGQMGAAIADSPFENLTQVHKYRAGIAYKWQLLIDSFLYCSHATFLNPQQAVEDESKQRK